MALPGDGLTTTTTRRWFTAFARSSGGADLRRGGWNDRPVDAETPGWDAIDGRLAEFYPGVEPQHYGTIIKFALGGPDPLDGISFYQRVEPVPHWHIVGYGLSELYAKESSEADRSGWGFELTFRVARRPDETDPPLWAAGLLQNLARYVFSSGNWFEAGHHMNANGPIRQDHPTAMTALAFVEDLELGAIDTPHGRLQFLQVVGLTSDEYAAARHWDTAGVLGLLAARQPLLVTDLDRPSLTDDPAARAAIEAGRARDGSSTGMLMVAGFAWSTEADRVRLRFSDVTAPSVADAVRDRLPHGRSLTLTANGATAVLHPAETYAARSDGAALELDLPPGLVGALPGALRPGTHVLTDGLIVEVTPEAARAS